MKRIVINESHIRQLVKETLENLIIGEDNIENDELLSDEEIKEALQNAEVKEVKYCSSIGNFYHIPYKRIVSVIVDLKNEEYREPAYFYFYISINDESWRDEVYYSFDVDKVELEMTNYETSKYCSDEIDVNLIPEGLWDEIKEEIDSNLWDFI